VNRILIGCKSDCDDRRTVTYQEGAELAKEYNIHFIETSAQNDLNVEKAFITLTTEIKNRVGTVLEADKSTKVTKELLEAMDKLAKEESAKVAKDKQNKEAAEKLENEKSIKEALTQGKKEWRRSKIMIVGEGRAGKTALANSILGRAYEDHDSTIGINEFTCSIGYASSVEGGKGDNRDHKNTWSELLDQKILKEVETAVASMIFDRKSGKTRNQKSQEASEEQSATLK
jgi:GTPase SAR1 family protein